MSEETNKPTKKYYDYISVGNRTKQVVYFVEQHDKTNLFELFFKDNSNKQIVVIAKSKRNADELGAFLKTKEMNATVIHGNHRVSQIEEAGQAFNAKDINILITTDKILETLELHNIQIILNYDLPLDAQSYFKTLRLVDEIGESISFVNSEDEKMLESIEFIMKYEIPREEIEAFKHTPLPSLAPKKEKKKKPRHKKSKTKKEKTSD
jgi:ATP-dependent RNA helicase RhlE